MKTLLSLTMATGFWAFGAAADTPRPDCEDFNNNDRMDSHDRQWCQALAIKENYLRDGYTETVPGSSGRATGVSSRLATSFSSSGASSIHGTVTIKELNGRFRLKLASTDNTLYYGRKVRIEGTAGVGDGTLEIYSRVETDLWKMSAVLVDRPIRGQAPPEEGLVLDGYVKTVVKSGPDVAFYATLIALAGDFYLVLVAPEGPVRDIRIEIAKD